MRDYAPTLPPDTPSERASGSVFAPEGPRWRLVYGIAYVAMVPLVGLALAMWMPATRGVVSLAFTAYVAMLIAFLSGLHWGIGLRYMATTSRLPAFHFIWGPVPSYLALGAMLLHTAIGLVLMALIFVLMHLVDRAVWPGSGLGPWLSLRLHITVVVVVCCLAGAGAFWK